MIIGLYNQGEEYMISEFSFLEEDDLGAKN